VTTPQQEQTSVPFEPYAQVLSAQRNQALDQVAQLQAIVHELRTDNERLTADNEKLRADTPTVAGSVEAQ
jgi:regulator of replication initiation timing